MGAAQPVSYRDAQFNVMPGLTAGPTFARVMEQLEGADLSTPAATYVAYARALIGPMRNVSAKWAMTARCQKPPVAPPIFRWWTATETWSPTPKRFCRSSAAAWSPLRRDSDEQRHHVV